MKWVRYRVRTTPEAEDILISELCALGFEGAQIEDNVPLTAAEKEQIYTYDADDPEDDGFACVSFYAELKDDGTVVLSEGFAHQKPEEIRKQAEEAIARLKERMDIGEGTVDVSVMDDADWKDNWKQFFHSFYVDDVFITPSWEEDADAETAAPDEENASGSAWPRYTLRIDPGMAFGTGAHETTQLAIRLLRKYMAAHEDRCGDFPDNRSREESSAREKTRGVRVLDIGTGSGILGILAVFFGAEQVVGVDVDAFTKEAVRQNLTANRIGDARFRLMIGNLLEEEAFRQQVLALSGEENENQGAPGYEIVLANILPVVLKPLTPLVPDLMAKDGIYITSGILCEKEGEMRDVLRDAGFVVLEIMRQGEWCAMAAKRA